MIVKRISIALILTVALVAIMSGIAVANFGPHGGYSLDTDACAGCHRAHTSFNDHEWVDAFDDTITHNALLIGDTTNVSEFCMVCHGDDAPGASTNVESGIFDSGPSGEIDDIIGSTVATAGATVADDANSDVNPILYTTDSSFEATLNGGGFVRMPSGSIGSQTFARATSAHNMNVQNAAMWGNGDGDDTYADFQCTGCHDPHGSANYRLLKGYVNGATVGGYEADGETPDPFVISAEVNYPAGGWLKHQDGADQMALYKPSYTSPYYANMNTIDDQGFRSMSVWCSACHQRYDDRDDTDAGTIYDAGAAAAGINGDETALTGGFTVGTEVRHRHPVNITLGAGVGITRSLIEEVRIDEYLPLEMAAGTDPADFRTNGWETDDFISCLTCHYAHGSSVSMEGWAEASLDTTNGLDGSWYVVLDPSGTNDEGVNPNDSTALLRRDNRGVCERCHNK